MARICPSAMSVLRVHGSLLQVHHLLEYLNKLCLRPKLEDAATLKLGVGAWGLRVWSKRRVESPTDLLSQAFNPPPPSTALVCINQPGETHVRKHRFQLLSCALRHADLHCCLQCRKIF